MRVKAFFFNVGMTRLNKIAIILLGAADPELPQYFMTENCFGVKNSVCALDAQAVSASPIKRFI
jgi:hypothetical protein